MITSHEQFNNMMANVLAAKYLQMMGGKVELTQQEITAMCEYGFQIKFKNPQQPDVSPLVMTLITREEAQKIMDQVNRKTAS